MALDWQLCFVAGVLHPSPSVLLDVPSLVQLTTARCLGCPQQRKVGQSSFVQAGMFQLVGGLASRPSKEEATDAELKTPAKGRQRWDEVLHCCWHWLMRELKRVATFELWARRTKQRMTWPRQGEEEARLAPDFPLRTWTAAGDVSKTKLVQGHSLGPTMGKV